MGPTAVGKTAFGISLAQALGTELISADARQCYQELNIGVARPSEKELATVPHHFIANHSIKEEVNAAIFEKEALTTATALLAQFGSVVMVGGTGLYIKAFCEGLDLIPKLDPQIRKDILQQYEKLGLRWLQKEISVKDPLYWAKGEQKNPQRLMRALEVKLGTGASILSFQHKNKLVRPFELVKIGMEMPRATLYDRINQRVHEMVEAGLEEEVVSLTPYFGFNALQTVGYQEWLPYFENQLSKEEVIAAIQRNTRQYAKRQMTWFRKDAAIRWYDASSLNTAQVLK